MSGRFHTLIVSGNTPDCARKTWISCAAESPRSPQARRGTRFVSKMSCTGTPAPGAAYPCSLKSCHGRPPSTSRTTVHLSMTVQIQIICGRFRWQQMTRRRRAENAHPVPVEKSPPSRSPSDGYLHSRCHRVRNPNRGRWPVCRVQVHLTCVARPSLLSRLPGLRSLADTSSRV